MKIGMGYDVHRLASHRKLVLGGVEIPFDKGLLGHSDADVLTHAFMDGLLGAAGKGDIGRHFPDSLEEYRDISSLFLLKRVWELIKEDGYSLVNADCTIVAQQPRLASYMDEMAANLAACLDCSPDRINIKATTEEGLGFTGSGEGMAAYAVCLLEKNKDHSTKTGE